MSSANISSGKQNPERKPHSNTPNIGVKVLADDESVTMGIQTDHTFSGVLEDIKHVPMDPRKSSLMVKT